MITNVILKINFVIPHGSSCKYEILLLFQMNSLRLIPIKLMWRLCKLNSNKNNQEQNEITNINVWHFGIITRNNVYYKLPLKRVYVIIIWSGGQ